MKSKSSTTTKKGAQRSALLPLVTPGEILKLEFLEPLGLTENGLAVALRVPQTRIHAIVNSARAISADTALRLGRYFGNSAEFWMNLQANYELDLAKRESLEQIEAEVSRRSAA